MRKFVIPNEISINISSIESELFVAITLEKIQVTRGAGSANAVLIDDHDIVEMELEDGTIWIGPALEMPSCFKKDWDSNNGLRGGNEGGDFEIPIYFEGLTKKRGLFNKIKIKALSFFRKKTTEKLAAIVVYKAAEKWDKKQQPNPGLHWVKTNLTLEPIRDALINTTDQPYLLFIHGTASKFEGSFGKIDDGDQTELFGPLRSIYGDRMLAFEHYTLTKTPIENTLDLVSQLPDDIELHLITHSRGGFIGDLISLFHPDNDFRGFTQSQLDIINKDSRLKKGLDELSDLLAHKRIRIGKFVRVACPALGTSLCSDRLDRFFNILLSGFKYLVPASGPAVEVLKEIIMAILSCKNDPKILPGIEVMSPDSHFIKAINQNERSVSAPLTVIQGHSTLDFNLRSIITLVSKLIYHAPNDWIVNTNSMTGGVNRKFRIGTYCYEGSDIQHFRYFISPHTRRAVLTAIKADSSSIPAGFESFDTIEDTLRGRLTGSYLNNYISGIRPVVILLPGILGSNLSVINNNQEEEIYLNFLKVSGGGMKRLAYSAQNIKATSVVGMAYKDLSIYLSRYYDVYTHPYDWRKSIDSEANFLSKVIADIIPKINGKPIMLIAHSMGGVVARHLMIKNYNQIWDKLSSQFGFRLLFLGSPLGGSYLIPEVLVGVGKRIRQLARIDLTSSSDELLHVFSEYKGLLNLLPLENSPHDFGKPETWKELKKNWDKNDWPIPDTAEFNQFRDEVLAMDQNLYNHEGIIYVAGKADQTTESYYFDDTQYEGRRLSFTSTEEGDGSVTWKSGIPNALKNSDKLYYVDTKHGNLAADEDLFGGLYDLLKYGTTNKFSNKPIKKSGGFLSRLFRGESTIARTTEELTKELLEFGDISHYEQADVPKLKVSVKCGDLSYHSFPVMIGHFENDRLWGAESAMNKHLEGALQRRIDLGVYPGQLGTMRVFQLNEKPKAIIIGIGTTDRINAKILEDCVMKAVISYSLSLQEKYQSFSKFELNGVSFLLIGSSYIGLSIRQSLEIIITAVFKANQGLLMNNENSPIFEEIEIIEVLEDKACTAFNELIEMSKSRNAKFICDPDDFKFTSGVRKRLAQDEKREWWLQLTVAVDKNEQEKWPIDSALLRMKYSLSENLARVRSEPHLISLDNLYDYIYNMSVDHKWSKPQAMALYTELIPEIFREAFQQQQNIKLVLDIQSAEFPWELVQDIYREEYPLITRCGFIRQLTTETNRARALYPANNKVLIVGDPDLAGWIKFDQLKGAEAEASEVEQMFTSNGYDSSAFISKSAYQINLNFKFEKFRIIHLAGHGEFDTMDPCKRGFIIGKERYLRTNDFKNLPYVPEFVFVNACYLGQINNKTEQHTLNRFKLAANIGSELIQLGVKAVVVSGWAVEDAPALEFAKEFYTSMFRGESFSDALIRGRRICYELYPNSNTWGAYQAYGDPQYRFSNQVYAPQHKEIMIYLDPQLLIELENLNEQVSMNGTHQVVSARMAQMEEMILSRPPQNPKIHEMMGMIYAQLGEIEKALDHFQKMKNYDDAIFSVKALELECRLKRTQILKQPVSDLGLKKLKAIENQIEMLLLVSQTRERYSLLGGTCKAICRYLILLQAIRPKLSESKEYKNYLKRAVDSYGNAVKLSDNRNIDILYPLINQLTLQCNLNQIEIKNLEDSKKADHTLLNTLKDAITKLGDEINNPRDYWGKMYKCNALLFELIIEPKDETRLELVEMVTTIWKTEGSSEARQIELDKIEFCLQLFTKKNQRRKQLVLYYDSIKANI